MPSRGTSRSYNPGMVFVPLIGVDDGGQRQRIATYANTITMTIIAMYPNTM